jgi:hypothetical protein
LRWSLDPDGTLVVGDTEICGKGECPSVVTTLKFKKKTRTERLAFAPMPLRRSLAVALAEAEASDERASAVEGASRGAGTRRFRCSSHPTSAVSAAPARADVFARQSRIETCRSE